MIYFDNNSTTKTDKRVLDAMIPYFTEQYGNAASNHEFGVHINQQVKAARASVARLIGCNTQEVIFTSGATESLNMALKGLVEMNQDRRHIITVKTEHKAVLDVCKYLEQKGCNITYLSVDSEGLIDLKALRQHLTNQTLVVAVMLVNNETGVIQPLKDIAELAHQYGAYVMSDATQAVGKMPVNVNELGVDLMAFSAHKFYGPMGIGGLFVRSRRPYRVKISAIQHGGGHERNMRSGTLNVPGIIGLGKASELALEEMKDDAKRIGTLRDAMELELLNISNTFINGSLENRLYNVSNICFVGADADAMIVGLNGIMLSNGSACTSTSIEPSHVLTAMGLSEENAYSCLRISLGRQSTKWEVQEAVNQIISIVNELKGFVN